MTVLSLDEVRVEPDAIGLASAGISQPSAGAVSAPTFVVRGWALGADARALAVEIRTADGRLVRVAPVREPTPEIAAALPDRPGAARCGFLTRVHVRAVEPGSELRLEAVLANGARAAIGTISLCTAEARRRERRPPPEPPSIRGDVERLVLAEADRLGVSHERLLDQAEPETLRDAGLEGLTVLDLSGGPGHTARAARAAGAAVVDSVHLDDDLADLARLLDLYHRATRVFVHDSLDALDRTYDVVLVPSGADEPDLATLEALGGPAVVRT